MFGAPTEALRSIIDIPKRRIDSTSNNIDLEEPEWKNPDGAALLNLALEQESITSTPTKIDSNFKIVYGVSPVEQGLALLQMISESLRIPYRRDVVDRMLSGMIGDRDSLSLEQVGQVADAVGLTAVLMELPPSISIVFLCQL